MTYSLPRRLRSGCRDCLEMVVGSRYLVSIRLQLLMSNPRSLDVPRLPVLGWQTFAGSRQPAIPSVLKDRSALYTTSGRAAIEIALQCLGVGRGDRVLVPTYHCATMVAPVVRQGAQPMFFPITSDGRPNLAHLRHQDLNGVRAMLAAHYFGLPSALDDVIAFCRPLGIKLIEDCAHCFFGEVDGRTVGSWGDFTVASLTKFFPVPEGGCLLTRGITLDSVALAPRSVVAEARAWWDAVELGARYRRFVGLNLPLRAMCGLKRRLRGLGAGTHNAIPRGSSQPSPDRAPSGQPSSTIQLTRAARWLARHARGQRIVANRRRNYLLLAELLRSLREAEVLHAALSACAVPYVFPLRVRHRSEQRYEALRAAGVPVFRWDQTWPGMPHFAGDEGVRWATEIYQISCHQDLSEQDIREVAATVRRVIEETY